MEKKERVFVTGASSELMLRAVSGFDHSKYEIIGLTRNPNPSNVDGLRWVVGPIETPEIFAAEIANADIIIHAAAITHTKNEKEYFRVNLEGTKNLIEAIPKGRRPLFVFISSRVAGEDSGAYGVSKLRAEGEVQKLANWIIIRPSEVYGGSKSEGIEKTIQSAISGGVQLCPIGIQSKMFPIHISDASLAISTAALNQHLRNKIVIVNGGKGYSFKELLLSTQAISGKKMTIIPIPKWFLKMVAFASSILPVNIGFVPDQVDRLYSTKEHSQSGSGVVRLEEYLKQEVEKRNG